MRIHSKTLSDDFIGAKYFWSRQNNQFLLIFVKKRKRFDSSVIFGYITNIRELNVFVACWAWIDRGFKISSLDTVEVAILILLISKLRIGTFQASRPREFVALQVSKISKLPKLLWFIHFYNTQVDTACFRFF